MTTLSLMVPGPVDNVPPDRFECNYLAGSHVEGATEQVAFAALRLHLVNFANVGLRRLPCL